MNDRKNIIDNLIKNSKKRVDWAFEFIKNQPNFRDELTPRLNYLYDFYKNDLIVNTHPEFWLKTHKLFELSDEEIYGKEIVIARNVIRSIDDYKQYLINKVDVGQKKEEKDDDKKTPTERGVFERPELNDDEDDEDIEDIEESDDNNDMENDDSTYGQLYKRKKDKRFYGNYYQTYGKNKKNKSNANKNKKIDYYTKSKKKSTKKKSSWVKSY